jgi:uncharacterized membrane protein YdjX (TVP38/TMEM64 family)
MCCKELERPVEQNKRISKQALVKILLFFVFIILAVCLFRIIFAKRFITPEALSHFLETSGFWAPLLFILIYAASVCVFVPASIPTILGASIFGAQWGFLYGWIGAMLGASGAFFIGRILGRDFTESLIGNGLRKYDDAIGRNGFAIVLYLRLINFPFTLMNFGICLTKIRFWDFFWGTAVGVILGIYILTFFGGVLKEVWTSGNWEMLLSLKAFLAVVLLIISLLIPRIIKKIKGETWVRSR